MNYPAAELAPWLYDNGGPAPYFRGSNKPVAAVLHIMEGHATTARQWALSGHYGASWHYTVCLDGSVMQHLAHTDGGYHAGIASPPAPEPTWSLWQGPTVNINNYTIGIEHEGFSGDGFPPAQAAASKALCQWLASELDFPYDREHFPPHADIDLVNRANDFAPPAMREAHYAYMFEEGDMADPRVDALIAALGGQAEIDKWNGPAGAPTGNSLLLGYAGDQQKLAEHIANHAAGATGQVTEHTHTPGKVAR